MSRTLLMVLITIVLLIPTIITCGKSEETGSGKPEGSSSETQEAINEEFWQMGTKSSREAREELETMDIPYASEEFMSRVEQGDVPAVELFLAAGMNPNVKGEAGRPALMFAVEKGHTDLVHILLDNGADANAKDDFGNTALMFAAMYGDTEIVSVLIDNGAEVNAENPGGVTVLMHATSGWERNTDVMRIPLEIYRGQFDDVSRKWKGHADTVKFLLKKGADVNAKTEAGHTALIDAAKWGRTETVRVLLDGGADVNVKRKDGLTALKAAREHGHGQIVQLLKQAGAEG